MVLKNIKALILMLFCIFAFQNAVYAESLFTLNASQSNFVEPRPLYGSVRARGVGDLLTIVINEVPTLTDKGIYQTKKSSNVLETITSALNAVFKTDLSNGFNGMNGSIDVSGNTSTERTLGIKDKVAVQVVQQLPNGNLLVQGKKTLVSSNERVDLLVSGVVDPRWIDQTGEVDSVHVANLQFAMSGAGTVSRGQNEGIINRFLRYIF